MSKKPILSKVIPVNGTKLTVHRFTFAMQLRRFTLMETAQTDPLIEGNGLEALLRNGFHRMTYPSLVACTKGDVPTEDEAMNLVQDELDAWLNTARELNPEWFPAPGVTEEELEKKE